MSELSSLRQVRELEGVCTRADLDILVWGGCTVTDPEKVQKSEHL